VLRVAANNEPDGSNHQENDDDLQYAGNQQQARKIAEHFFALLSFEKMQYFL
jgi:hypothetical protein